MSKSVTFIERVHVGKHGIALSGVGFPLGGGTPIKPPRWAAHTLYATIFLSKLKTSESKSPALGSPANQQFGCLALAVQVPEFSSVPILTPQNPIPVESPGIQPPFSPFRTLTNL